MVSELCHLIKDILHVFDELSFYTVNKILYLHTSYHSISTIIKRK